MSKNAAVECRIILVLTRPLSEIGGEVDSGETKGGGLPFSTIYKITAKYIQRQHTAEQGYKPSTYTTTRSTIEPFYHSTRSEGSG